MKTLKITIELHKALKMYCVENNISIINFIDEIIKKEIKYDNNKKLKINEMD